MNISWRFSMKSAGTLQLIRPALGPLRHHLRLQMSVVTTSLLLPTRPNGTSQRRELTTRHLLLVDVSVSAYDFWGPAIRRMPALFLLLFLIGNPQLVRLLMKIYKQCPSTDTQNTRTHNRIVGDDGFGRWATRRGGWHRPSIRATTFTSLLIWLTLLLTDLWRLGWLVMNPVALALIFLRRWMQFGPLHPRC